MMMMDSEKVIKTLTAALTAKENYPWAKAEMSFEFIEMLLALLKEQEVVEPYIAGNGESFETAETWWYECGNCNKPIDPNDKFCRHCGKKVKWE